MREVELAQQVRDQRAQRTANLVAAPARVGAADGAPGHRVLVRRRRQPALGQVTQRGARELRGRGFDGDVAVHCTTP